MIDTHCHLTYDPIQSQFDAVLRRARDAGVDRMVSIGTSPPDALKAIALSQAHPHIFAAAGLHPHYAAQWPDRPAFVAALTEALRSPRVVAIGEMGLDRHYAEPSVEVQRRSFEWQLAILSDAATGGAAYGDSATARRIADLPVIIHNRQATDETIAVIRDSGLAPSRFVFHCFTGSDAELDAILTLGAMVSFTGIVTFKNSIELSASAARVPIDRVMIETDAPYLTPAPHRKVKVNEPSYLVHTARHMAQARGLSEADFVRAVDANAVRFFRLPTA